MCKCFPHYASKGRSTRPSSRNFRQERELLVQSRTELALLLSTVPDEIPDNVRNSLGKPWQKATLAPSKDLVDFALKQFNEVQCTEFDPYDSETWRLGYYCRDPASELDLEGVGRAERVALCWRLRKRLACERLRDAEYSGLVDSSSCVISDNREKPFIVNLISDLLMPTSARRKPEFSVSLMRDVPGMVNDRRRWHDNDD